MPEKKVDGELPRRVQFTITRDEAHFLMGLLGIGDSIHDLRKDDGGDLDEEQLARRIGIFHTLMWRGDEIADGDGISHGAWHSLREKVIEAFGHADPAAHAHIQELIAYAEQQAELIQQLGSVLGIGEDAIVLKLEQADANAAPEPPSGPAPKNRRRRRKNG